MTVLPPVVSSAAPPPLPYSPDTSSEQPLLESYARFRSSPLDALRELSLQVSGSGWRSYENVIGQDVFYKGYSERMKNMVMANPRLLAKISQLAQSRVEAEAAEGALGDKGRASGAAALRQQDIESQLKEVAELWTDQMICKMESNRFIRGAYYLCTQLLTRAYHQGACMHARLIISHNINGLVQAFTYQAKKSSASAPWPKKQRRRTSPSSFFHVIDHMWTMFLYNSSATASD